MKVSNEDWNSLTLYIKVKHKEFNSDRSACSTLILVQGTFSQLTKTHKTVYIGMALKSETKYLNEKQMVAVN